MSHNILTNHVAAPTVTHVCNHKTHDLRFVFYSGTKHKSESLFLCFKYELQVRLVCNQHLLSWKHTGCLETLVYQKFLTIYGSFKTLMVRHGGSSAGSYLADPTSPIPSHCASIVGTSTFKLMSPITYKEQQCFLWNFLCMLWNFAYTITSGPQNQLFGRDAFNIQAYANCKMNHLCIVHTSMQFEHTKHNFLLHPVPITGE